MSAIERDPERSLAGRAAAITIGAAFGALGSLFVLYAISPHMTGWVDVVVAAAVLVIGSILAGRSLGTEPTIRPILAALIVPLLVAGPMFLIMAGLSASADDMPTALLIALGVYALQTVPMLVVQRLRSARSGET